MPLHLPRIIGHRASRREGVYENSPRAFEAAAEYADGLETDAVLSADGDVFFIHDMTCSATESFSELDIHIDEASRKISKGRSSSAMSAAEVRALSLIDGQKIPDFTDLMACTAQRRPDFVFNVEIRAVGIFAPVMKNIAAARVSENLQPEQFLISSFDWPELASGRSAFPEARIGVLFEPGNLERLPIYPGKGLDDRRFTPFSHAHLDDPILQEIAPDFICLNEYDFRPENVAQIVERFPEVKILVWWYYPEPPPQDNHRFFNTLGRIEKAGLSRYLFAIITDWPKAMTAFMNERG